MSLTIITNKAAMSSLQNLNATTDNLEQVQSRLGTGLRIATSKDNSAIWAIAQTQRADMGGLAAVRMGLDRAMSIGDTALTAGQSVAELLVKMKERVVAAQDVSINGVSRQALQEDFSALLRQVAQVVRDAAFDDVRLLDNSLPGGVRFLADAEGAAFITLANQDLRLGQAVITLSVTASVLTLSTASASLALLNASIDNVSLALSEMGAQLKQLEQHNTFVGKLSDSVEGGVGNLVDADLAKESARLQALTVHQQLGAQALAIANQAPQIILSLFRSG
ncbi:flagellin [Phenylobacterium sp.]|uniref:flagellin n=1 Tax=Phenylobacterium sp. TaxID=1871053 RepID=UPI0025D6FBD3|nr:flagellin [Phenylobacterium sp.]MCA6284938.1 flagellin [Phenylobacterium sp.]MCA6311585.1 flagellin [Phenylobacterium sp.]MCA6324335.1 flagellin [Phenylobacterium sp.]MCA6338339.1 flagellin [Phenylobacterium sp.]MCA6340265.1 flagellin [Phenylobacterium sp.]